MQADAFGAADFERWHELHMKNRPQYTKIIKKCATLMCGIAIGAMYSHIAISNMSPPLENEYESLAEDIYDFYNKSGQMPTVEQLSEKSQALLKSQLSYSPENGLSYTYNAKYPINKPFVGIVTMGMYWGSADLAAGTLYSPEDIANNASLREQ